MKYYLHLSRKRRHELMAGAFAILSSIWLLQYLASSTCMVKTDAAPPVVNTLPAVMGTWTDEAVTVDVLARSAETARSVSVPETKAAANEEAVRTPAEGSAEARPHSEPIADEAEPLDAKQPGEEEPDKPRPDDGDVDLAVSEEQEGQAVVAVDELMPTSNPVEEAPKPVDEMSPEEIAKAVEEYMAWVHRGRITLKLDYSRLPADKLDLIASYYLLSTATGTLRVEPNGDFERLSATNVPAGEWVCDLPVDRKRWPLQVARRARLAFGQFYSLANANFMLTDECALKLFRFLAQAVGDTEPAAGTVFVIRLHADESNRIKVELLG